MPISGPKADAVLDALVEPLFADTTKTTHAKQKSIAMISVLLTLVPSVRLAIIVVMKGFVEKITVNVVTGMKLRLFS